MIGLSHVPVGCWAPQGMQHGPAHLHTLLCVALQRLPVPKAVRIPLLDVLGLVAQLRPPGVVVDVAHHGRLDLQRQAGSGWAKGNTAHAC